MLYKNLKQQALNELAEYHTLPALCDSLARQIDLLQQNCKILCAQANLSAETSSRHSKRLADTLDRIQHLQDLLEDTNLKYTTMQTALNCLSEEEYQLIFGYYINRQIKSVIHLSIDSHTDRSWLYRKAEKALKKFILAYYGTIGQ